MVNMSTFTPSRRWYYLTPERFFIGLLVVQLFLLLSPTLRDKRVIETSCWTRSKNFDRSISTAKR